MTRPGFACRIKLTRARQSADLELDGEVYNSRVAGSYYELNTHQTILFGEPKNVNISSKVDICIAKRTVCRH